MIKSQWTSSESMNKAYVEHMQHELNKKCEKIEKL